VLAQTEKEMEKEHGLLHLLERSAELLELSAEEIRIAHTVRGRWSRDDEHGAKRDFKELRDMAKGLRKAHKYHKPNCLGGPAKMFDAIADRIRAGEKMMAVMADYEMKFKRPNAQVQAGPAGVMAGIAPGTDC
jgi:hypothetical protein